MIDKIILKAKDKMEAVVDFTSTSLATIRSNRISSDMFSHIKIKYYGSLTPVTQLSSISISETNVAFIRPYEASQLNLIEDALKNSDLGVVPSNDGIIIKIIVPSLTSERRKELVKRVRQKSEDAKIKLRNIRRKTMEELIKIKKSGESGKDEVSRAEKDIDKFTHIYTNKINNLIKLKESELIKL